MYRASYCSATRMNHGLLVCCIPTDLSHHKTYSAATQGARAQVHGGVGVQAACPWLSPHEQIPAPLHPQRYADSKGREGQICWGCEVCRAIHMTVSAMARTPKFVTELTSHPEIFWSNAAPQKMPCSNTRCTSAGARRSGRASSIVAAPSSRAKTRHPSTPSGMRTDGRWNQMCWGYGEWGIYVMPALARTNIFVTELVSHSDMPEGVDSTLINIACSNTRCERKRTGGVGVRAAGPWLPPHDQRLGNPAPLIAVCGLKAEGITKAGGTGSGAYM